MRSKDPGDRRAMMKPPEDHAALSARTPGKRTLTMDLPPPATPAPPRERAAAPGEARRDAHRQRADYTRACMAAAMRPDLYPMPMRPPGLDPVQAKGKPPGSPDPREAEAERADDAFAAGRVLGREAILHAARAGNWHAVLRGLDALPDMPALLDTLETLDRLGTLEALWTAALQHAWNDGRLTTALYLVKTIGRGSRALGDLRRLHTAMERLSDADKRDIVAYVARKVGVSDETEGLLALVDSPLPPGAEAAIAATAPGPVAKGPWEPPGKQPGGLYVGREAHEQIGLYYQAHHATALVFLNDAPVSTILRNLVDNGIGPASNETVRAEGEYALRPDITNATTLELYEIKPAAAQAEAQSRLSYYLAIFHKAGVPMKPGTTSAPGTQGILPAPAGHFRFYAPMPGIILYQYRPGAYVPAPQPQEQGQEQEPSAPSWWRRMEEATGLTGAALLIYLLISEGSRVAVPLRNFVPVP